MSDDDSDQPAPPPTSIMKRPSSYKRPAAQAVKAEIVKKETATKAITVKKTTTTKEGKPTSPACSKLLKSIDMTNIFRRLRKMRHEEGMYKNKFTSRAYAAGRKVAKEAGAIPEVEIEFGGHQYRRAAAEWDASS